MKKHAFILVILIIFYLSPAYAQTTDEEPVTPVTPTAPETPATPIRTEAIPAVDSMLKAQADTAAVDTVPDVKKKSVPTAMLLSTFVPGGGQFYTGHFIKGLLIAGGEVTLGYFTFQEHQSLREALADTSISATSRDSIRTRRNNFAFFTGAVIVYAIADAYVDAHMFGFKEEQRLTVGPTREHLGLALTYRF